MEQDRNIALRGASVHRAFLPRWEPTGLRERKPCEAKNPWGCLHATSVETEGMERLQPWDGCFAFSPLPRKYEHPYPRASYGWTYWLRELDRGCIVEDGAVQETCWMLAQHRLPPGAPDGHKNLSESKCLPGIRGLCMPHAGLTGMINTHFSPWPSPR